MSAPRRPAPPRPRQRPRPRPRGVARARCGSLPPPPPQRRARVRAPRGARPLRPRAGSGRFRERRSGNARATAGQNACERARPHHGGPGRDAPLRKRARAHRPDSVCTEGSKKYRTPRQADLRPAKNRSSARRLGRAPSFTRRTHRDFPHRRPTDRPTEASQDAPPPRAAQAGAYGLGRGARAGARRRARREPRQRWPRSALRPVPTRSVPRATRRRGGSRWS